MHLGEWLAPIVFKVANPDSLRTVLTLTATYRQTPPDHKGGYDLEVQYVEHVAETYDEAFAAAREKTPEGWSLIGVMSDSW